MGWALAHKGKASEVTYNPDDPPSAYSNPSVHTRINMYKKAGRQVHGPDWDPSAHDLDGELIMKVGGGKKHGRYFIGEGTLDTASTPLSPRFEPGPRTVACPYAQGYPWQSSKYRNLR